MDLIRPILAGDIDELMMAPIEKLKAQLPVLSANSCPSLISGIIFNPATQSFTLHGTTIASFFVANGQMAVTVSDGKVSENMLLQASSLEFDKLMVIDSRTVMAVSGSVSYAVLYTKILRNWVETMERLREEPISTRAKVNTLSSILRNSLPLAMAGMVVVPILTTYDDKHGPRIFSFTPDGSVVNKKTYAIGGSGRVNEGGILQQWRADMSLEEGIELAKNLVRNAHQMDKATGGKIFIKVVSSKGIETIDGGWTNE